MTIKEILNSSKNNEDETEKLRQLIEDYNKNKAPNETKTRIEELKERFEQINKEQLKKEQNRKYDETTKKQVEVLSLLKKENGEKRFSEEHLSTISSFEIESTYKDCIKHLPDDMKAAANKAGIDISKDFAELEKIQTKNEQQEEPPKEEKMEVQESKQNIEETPTVEAPSIETPIASAPNLMAAPIQSNTLQEDDQDYEEEYELPEDTSEFEESIVSAANNLATDNEEGPKKTTNVNNCEEKDVKKKIDAQALKSYAIIAAVALAAIIFLPLNKMILGIPKVAAVIAKVVATSVKITLTHPATVAAGLVAVAAGFEIHKGRKVAK